MSEFAELCKELQLESFNNTIVRIVELIEHTVLHHNFFDKLDTCCFIGESSVLSQFLFLMLKKTHDMFLILTMCERLLRIQNQIINQIY